MTAAGLYRHCRDKADLFREIVEPSVQRIEDWIQAHIARSETAMRTDSVDLGQDSEIVMMRELIYTLLLIIGTSCNLIEPQIFHL